MPRAASPTILAHESSRLDIRFDRAEELRTIAAQSIDHIITSPPYNFRKDYGEWSSDKKSRQEYQAFVYCHLAQALRVLKSGGSYAINLPARSFKQGEWVTRLWSSTLEAMGFIKNAEIQWNKIGGNYQNKFTKTANDLVPRCEALVESLLFYNKPPRPSMKHLTREERDRFHTPVWALSPIGSQGGHPCPFPEPLVCRMMTFTGVMAGDAVLDPFCGTGTTGLVAEAFGAHVTLRDVNPTYLAYARQRFITTQHVCRENGRHNRPLTQPAATDQVPFPGPLPELVHRS